MHFIEAKNGIDEIGHFEIAYNPNQYRTIQYRRINSERREKAYVATIPRGFPSEIGALEFINRLHAQHPFVSNKRFSPGNNEYDTREPANRVGNGRNFIRSGGENYELGYGVSKNTASFSFTINLEHIVSFNETIPPDVIIDEEPRSKIWLRFKRQKVYESSWREYLGGWIDYTQGQSGQLVTSTVELLNLIVRKYRLPLWKRTP